MQLVGAGSFHENRRVVGMDETAWISSVYRHSSVQLYAFVQIQGHACLRDLRGEEAVHFPA